MAEIKQEVAKVTAKNHVSAEEVLNLPSMVNPKTGIEPHRVFQPSLPNRLREKKRVDTLRDTGESNKDLKSVIEKIHTTTHVSSSSKKSS